jgi:hypothetical protein
MDGSSLSNIAQLDEFYRYQTAARPHRCLSERLVPPLARADLRRARVVNSVIAASPLAKAPPLDGSTFDLHRALLCASRRATRGVLVGTALASTDASVVLRAPVVVSLRRSSRSNSRNRVPWRFLNTFTATNLLVFIIFPGAEKNISIKIHSRKMFPGLHWHALCLSCPLQLRSPGPQVTRKATAYFRETE